MACSKRNQIDLNGLWQAIPRRLFEIAQIFETNGFETHLVGGCVRDLLLGQQPKDWDFATNAKPKEVQALFPQANLVGEKYGTVGWKEGSLEIQLTTYRTETDYVAARYPQKVYFEQDLYVDLERRDFTINAIAIDLLQKTIVDPFCGQQDLDQKVLRCVGSAAEKFQQDALRILRVCRFVSRLGLEISTEITIEARNWAHQLRKISPERIGHELLESSICRYPSKGFLWLHSIQAFDYLDLPPEFSPQPKLWKALDSYGSSVNLARAWLVICTLVGATITEESGIQVKQLLRRWNWPKQVVREISNVYVFLNQVLEATTNQRLDLTNVIHNGLLSITFYEDPAFCQGIGWSLSKEAFSQFRLKFEAIIKSTGPIGMQDLALGAREISNQFGVAGPRLGRLMQDLLALVQRQPQINQKDELPKHISSLLDIS